MAKKKRLVSSYYPSELKELPQQARVILAAISAPLLLYFLVSMSFPQTSSRLFAGLYPNANTYAASLWDSYSGPWAFEERFDYGTPTTPSTSLLPRNFDYVSTHRSHPAMHDGIEADGTHGYFPADHGENCSPPPNWADPNNQPAVPKNQHTVESSHRSNSKNPESSFYVCNNHMMSSIGDIDGYSVTAFWPRQEFDFTNGGVIEFEASITAQSRNWWEVLIVPREQTQMGAAAEWLPISETYPKDRIVLSFTDRSGRSIEVGKGAVGEKNKINSSCCEHSDWRYEWIGGAPEDPALLNPMIRRKHRIVIENNKISWSVEKRDGTYHTVATTFNELPFKKGLVMFKTHGYTPNKDGVHKRHTVHWDNIRFSGAKQTPYVAYEADSLVKLYGNGSRTIGETETISIDIPTPGTNPAILGQVGGGGDGQVLLSINGSPNLVVRPHSSEDAAAACEYGNWRTFWFRVDPTLLKVGKNDFKWTIGPRPSCASSWYWDGFGVKALEVQFDASNQTPVPTVPPTGTPQSADINKDGRVDVFDLGLISSRFGQTITASSDSISKACDINQDTVINVFDLGLLIGQYR